MTAHVLLLNADYTPIKIIGWERAITMLLDHKVALVEHYVDRVIRTTTRAFEFPAVVALKKYARNATAVKFSRANVLARDGYTCQYCLTRPRTPTGRPDLEELTIEHIVPRAQAHESMFRGRQVPTVTLPWNGKTVPVTCWENVVAACIDCNLSKRDRTPKEAGMKLRKYPTKPNVMDVVMMSFLRMTIPEEWRLYLPDGSKWADYWDGELES